MVQTPALAILPSIVAQRNRFAHVAQLVEHVLGKDEVTGSIPVVGSMSCEYKTIRRRLV